MEPRFGPPWKRILCPIDFSERSRSALLTAVAMARVDRARLSIVHVAQPFLGHMVPFTSSTTPIVTVPAEWEKTQAKVHEAQRESLGHLGSELIPASLEWDHAVLVGRPADELARYAEVSEVELIVMATRGHGRWKRFLFGSVTERLLKLTELPVLVLPIQ